MTDSALPFRGRQTAEEILEPSPWSKLRKRVFKNYSFLIGAIILVSIISVALLAPVFEAFGWIHDPYDQDTGRRLLNPFWYDTKTDPRYILGTDKVGRDY
ncbi:MAG: hypothetical protein AB8B85_17075, partial [Paracoccaceae bacterium]